MEKKNRIAFYSFVTFGTLLMPTARVVDFLVNYKKTAEVQFSLREEIKNIYLNKTLSSPKVGKN